MTPFAPKSLIFQVSAAKKSKGDFCCAIACRQKPNPKKGGLCNTHYNRHRRIIDPVYCRFQDFKRNALRRSKDFTITLQEFRKFCQDTGYIVTKGRRGYNATIDRIDNRFGYHIWNIQLLTHRANIVKYHGVDKHVNELPPDHEDYVPF